MTALCKDMGMMVVGEGVENVEERGRPGRVSDAICCRVPVRQAGRPVSRRLRGAPEDFSERTPAIGGRDGC